MDTLLHFIQTLSTSESIGLGTIIHVIIAVSIILHVLTKPRAAHISITWIFIAVTLPVVGLIAYILFGINSIPHKAWKKQTSDRSFKACQDQADGSVASVSRYRMNYSVTAGWAAEPAMLEYVLSHLSPTHALLTGNAIEIIPSGIGALEKMFEALAQAKQHIHLSTYILNDDAIGRRLMDVLVERARAGVQVRVLYDAFGSLGPRWRGFFRRYRSVPNLQVIGFSQANILKGKFQFALRNHRKILVVDGRIGFLGGVNFHDVYLPDPRQGGTLDYHFEVRGPAVLELQYTFLRDWFYMTDATAEELLTPAHFPVPECAGACIVRLQNSGPTHDEANHALDAYFAAINAAQKQIVLVTPYFVPPHSLILALRHAAFRGVDVRILVPSVNNHFGTQMASHAIYSALLTAGVRIFERRPPFMHTKLAIVDDNVALIGSVNVDPRSLMLNYETNLAVFNADFAARLRQSIQFDFDHADELFYSEWRLRSKKKQLLENFFYLFHPIA